MSVILGAVFGVLGVDTVVFLSSDTLLEYPFRVARSGRSCRRSQRWQLLRDYPPRRSSGLT